MKYIRKLKVVIVIGVLATIFVTINTIKAYTNYQKQLKESAINITKTDKIMETQIASNKDIIDLAEEYYIDDELVSFCKIFSDLDDNIKLDYCNRMIEDSNISFFSSILKDLDDELINACAEKAYSDDEIKFFSLIVPYMTDDIKQYWIEESSQDGYNNFLWALKEYKTNTQKVNLNNNESSTVYSYSQRRYYQKPYIIWIGWNLSEKLFGYYYPHKTKEIELSDGTNLIVSFEKPFLEYMDNQEFISNLTELLEKLKTENAYSSRPLEKPLVGGVDYVGDKDVTELAEEYYIDDELVSFCKIFSDLDDNIKLDYCNRMIEDSNISFFSSILKDLDDELINACAEKAYSDDEIKFFSLIVPYMTDDIKQYWIEESSQDGYNNFLWALKEYKTNTQKVNLNNNESSTVYSYSQRGYYQKPYIIWTGWNLSEKLFGYYYPHKTKEIELSDGTNLIVSFEKPFLEYMDNQEFISNLTELLEKLKAENAYSSRPLEKPLVGGVDYVGDKDVTELAEEYYTNEELTRFSTILENLDVDLINTYAQRAYSEGKLVYFSATVPYMTDDIKKDWAEKSFKDGNAAYSAVLR